MKTHYLVFFGLFFPLFILSQLSPGGYSIDKNGNLFCVGSYSGAIDLGDNAVFRAKSGEELFIIKYNTQGQQLWASHFGDKHSIDAASISTDDLGNSFITGSFDSSAKFRTFKIVSSTSKSYASPNFYLLKLNVSGDPVWVKYSKNSGRDEGCFVSTDPSGNIFVAGTFDEKFELDGQFLTSNANQDVFLMKLGADGHLIWLKNFGDASENTCSALYVKGSNVYLGTGSIADAKYHGSLMCISNASGDKLWQAEVGNSRGSVDAIHEDLQNNIVIAGTIESRNNSEYTELLIGKYNSQGFAIWSQRYTGGFPAVTSIDVSSKGEIYVSGSINDSLRLGKQFQGAYPKEDIFLAKFNSAGQALNLMVTGNSKTDKGTFLALKNDNLILGGYFSDGLKLGTHQIKGPQNSMFMARFELSKMICSDLKLLASESLFGEEMQTTNIYGKLLIGEGNNKNFLSEQGLHIENTKGEVLKRTITDEKGDFSFKNIKSDETINIVIEESEKLKETDQIYLATQTGIIVDKISAKDKKFVYPVIPAEISRFEEIQEPDISLKFSDFGTNGGKEFMVTERIQYEANSWTIPPESMPFLQKVVQYMKKYSRTKIEINSYTDALGDEEFNQKLSVIRGEEIKEFFIKNKISYNRISVIGHGENQILNRCTEGIHCAESEHAFNRRIELRFYLGSGL